MIDPFTMSHIPPRKYFNQFWKEILGFCVSLLLFSSCSGMDSSGNDGYRAQSGIMDLRNVDFSKKPILKLDGEWVFYPDTLNPDPSEMVHFIQVPGTWNTKMNNQGLGIGTYKLLVHLPTNLPKLAIQLNDISAAHELYVNGELVNRKGVIGTNRHEMQPSYKRPLIILSQTNVTLANDTLDLELRISNFYHPKGGIRSSIELGDVYSLIEAKRTQSALVWIVVGSTFLMGIYHFVIYFMRRIDRSALWFAFFCVSVGFRALFDKSVFIYEVFPDQFWILIHKIDVISFIITLPIFSFFLHAIFPDDFHKKALKLFVAIGAIFIFIVVIFPSNFYMIALNYFEISIIMAILYYCYLMVITIRRHRDGSYLFLIGSIILFGTVINDILNQMRIIFTGYHVSWGFLAFLFSQTTLLSMRFSSAFVRLEELQKSLESKVVQRTSELNIAKKKAEDANQLKDKFLSLVSHDLRSPIASVIGLLNLMIQDYEEFSDEEKMDFIKKALNSSNHSLEMISQLLDMNRLRTGAIQIHYSSFNVQQEVEKTIDKLWLHWHQKGIKIINIIPTFAIIRSDKSLLNEIFFNLISNAIKFSDEGDSITILMKDLNEWLEFSVQDTGIGIHPEILPFIFQAEQKTTTKGTKGEAGTGLGLPFVKEMLDSLGGSISVHTETGKGTRFTFRIPNLPSPTDIVPNE